MHWQSIYLAKRIQKQAEKKEQNGYLISAAELYLRASIYWRTSLICFNQPKDERVEKYTEIATKCYEDYLRVSGYPGAAIDIPYENTTFVEIFDKVMKLPAMVRPKMVYGLMDDYAWKHGVSRDEIIEELKKYDNTSIMNLITCKTLVLDGTAEINKGSARIFFDALTNCEKEYMCFDTESTAQHHAQMGGYQVGPEFIGEDNCLAAYRYRAFFIGCFKISVCCA